MWRCAQQIGFILHILSYIMLILTTWTFFSNARIVSVDIDLLSAELGKAFINLTREAKFGVNPYQKRNQFSHTPNVTTEYTSLLSCWIAQTMAWNK